MPAGSRQRSLSGSGISRTPSKQLLGRTSSKDLLIGRTASKDLQFVKDDLQRNGLKASAPDFSDTESQPDAMAAPVVQRKGSKEAPFGEASRLARKYHLDLSEVKHILKIFVEADDNDSGGLDKTEFTKVLRRVFDLDSGPLPAGLLEQCWKAMVGGAPQGQVEASADLFLEWYTANMFTAMVREADGNKGENVSYELAKKYNTDIITVDKVRKRFDKFDLDGSGTIDYEEFLQMMVFVLKAKDVDDISEDRAQRFWREIDQDGSGAIEFVEFFDWFVKYFNPDEEEMDLSKGPVSKFYASFNPMAKSISGTTL